MQDLEVSPDDGALKVLPPAHSAYPTEFSQQPLAQAAAGVSCYMEKTLPSSYPARLQVPPLMPKTPSGRLRLKLMLKLRRYLRVRDQREELPDMPPPAAEQESR